MVDRAIRIDSSPQHDQLGRLGHAKQRRFFGVASQDHSGSGFSLFFDWQRARMAGGHGTRKGGE